MFEMKINLDHHGPRLIPNDCHLLYPPYFSLISIFHEAIPFYEFICEAWVLHFQKIPEPLYSTEPYQ
jgi:hypothetical protein